MQAKEAADTPHARDSLASFPLDLDAMSTRSLSGPLSATHSPAGSEDGSPKAAHHSSGRPYFCCTPSP